MLMLIVKELSLYVKISLLSRIGICKLVSIETHCCCSSIINSLDQRNRNQFISLLRLIYFFILVTRFWWLWRLFGSDSCFLNIFLVSTHVTFFKADHVWNFCNRCLNLFCDYPWNLLLIYVIFRKFHYDFLWTGWTIHRTVVTPFISRSCFKEWIKNT